MAESIVCALIGGLVTLVGVVLSNNKTAAVMETKIENLTKEVEKHNNFARRMPVVEEKICVVNNRLKALEAAQK